jgi:hypothetical protein
MPRPRHRFIPTLEPLADRLQPAVLNYGGAVLPHVEAQAVYLGQEWAAPTPGQPTPVAIDASLSDLVGGAYMDALSQAGYGVGRGTASTGAVDRTTLNAGSVISDQSIQAGLQADIRSGLVKAPDANRLYVVYVQPDVAVDVGYGQGTTQQGILGYHGAFGGVDAAGYPVTIRYAVVAYPGGAAGNTSLGVGAVDQLTAVASHEVAEGVTDPDVNYGPTGWYDPRRGEIGDITENNSNALVRSDGYLVQEVAGRNDQLLALPTAPAQGGSTAPGPQTTPSPAPAPVTAVPALTLSAGPVTYHGWWYPPTVTLTAVVSGGVQAGGTVELVYAGQVIGTATVQMVGGVAEAQFQVAFGGWGPYSFSAQYAAPGLSAPSPSNDVTVWV